MNLNQIVPALEQAFENMQQRQAHRELVRESRQQRTSIGKHLVAHLLLEARGLSQPSELPADSDALAKRRRQMTPPQPHRPCRLLEACMEAAHGGRA